MSENRPWLQWTDPAAAEALAALAVDEPQDWRDRGDCAEIDPEIWFPDKGGSTREAKRICRGCPVRAECLEYALEHDERFGIWGAMSECERRTITRLRRANPPAVAAVAEKTCTVCGFTKPLEEFHRRTRSSDGHEQRCKACRHEDTLRQQGEPPSPRTAGRVAALVAAGEKTCTKCGAAKPLAEFSPMRTGFQSWCRECKRQANRVNAA